MAPRTAASIDRGGSVRRVKEAIAERQKEVSELPFLRRLEGGPATGPGATLVCRELTFWVMTFQDVLRINAAKVIDPEMQRIAEEHLKEDRGHEQWFWHDAERLGALQPPSWVFGPEHEATRDIGFEVMSEVFRTENDVQRIALVLALEGTGHVFFPRVISFFGRAGVGAGLKYFAASHLEVERDHDVFVGQSTERIDTLVLSAADAARGVAVVDRVFGVFARFSAALEAMLGSAELAEQRLLQPWALASKQLDVAVDTGVGRESFGTDFGHIVRAGVHAVVRPKDPRDVERVVAFANEHGVRLAVRAGGNSQSGQSVPDAGVSLDVSALADVVIDEGELTCRSGPGATWRQIVAASLPAGLVPPVVPLNLDVTIGGALSAGGFGSSSHLHATAASHVAELCVVTGQGQRVTCSEQLNPELFHAAVANQGRCGVIVEATLRLRRVRGDVHTVSLAYESLPDLLSDMQRLRDATSPDRVPEYMDAFCASTFLGIQKGERGYQPTTKWAYSLHVAYERERAPEVGAVVAGLRSSRVVKEESDSLSSFLARFDSRFAAMKQTGAWGQAHPWMECVLSADRAADCIEGALRRLPPFLGDGQRIFVLPKQRYPKLFALPQASSLVGFAVLPAGVPAPLEPPARAAIEAISAAMVGQGAKRYLSGWLGRPDDAYWRGHYGDLYADWVGLKQRFDPNGVLGSVLFPGANSATAAAEDGT